MKPYTVRTTPRWKIWMARMFGEKMRGTDNGYWVLAYKWRGKLYIVDEGYAEPHSR